MTTDPAALAKLDELLAAIKTFDDPRRASDQWKQVYKLLGKTDLPPGRITGIVGMRDVAALAAVIEQLRTPESATPPPDAPDAETCRQALHAFRKRLALTVLDEESKLGRSPLTKGAGGGSSITPPTDWPQAVWDELVRQGKLKYLGHKLYTLPKP